MAVRSLIATVLQIPQGGPCHPEVVAGMNPMDLKRGIDAAVKMVLEEAADRGGNGGLDQGTLIEPMVATISANGDAGIGKMVADAFEKVGKQGTITVAEAGMAW
eukprot:Skav200988  [mRNA]  locus=scaffold991:32233:34035:+ [translate_table: standard]